MKTAHTIDTAVLRIVELLGFQEEDDHAWLVDRLIRMGYLEAPGVADATRRLCISRRVLLRQLTAAGLPGPGQLLTWGRLIAALEHLEAEPSVERAARAGGWSTEGLSHAFRIRTQRTPGEWKEAGLDVEELCDVLVASWRGEAA